MLQYVLVEHPFFALTSLLYLASTLAYAAAWASQSRWPGRAGTAFMAAGVVLNTAVIAGRWVEAGRAPFKSLFESLVFFAFCIALLYVIFERLYRTRLFGVAAGLMAFGSMAYALAKWDAEIVKLPPARSRGST